MKKWLVLMLAVFAVFATACGDEKKETSSDTIAVDEGLLNVEITLPAEMFEGQDMTQVMEDAKADGMDDVILNEDGSLTYKMSKATHKELLKEMEVSMDEMMEEMITSEEFSSIKDVTANKDYDEFTLVVAKEQYESSFDAFSVFSIGLSSMYYQLFTGVDAADYKVTLHLIDEATNEEFSTVVLPDDLEEDLNTEATETEADAS